MSMNKLKKIPKTKKINSFAALSIFAQTFFEEYFQIVNILKW